MICQDDAATMFPCTHVSANSYGHFTRQHRRGHPCSSAQPVGTASACHTACHPPGVLVSQKSRVNCVESAAVCFEVTIMHCVRDLLYALHAFRRRSSQSSSMNCLRISLVLVLAATAHAQVARPSTQQPRPKPGALPTTKGYPQPPAWAALSKPGLAWDYVLQGTATAAVKATASAAAYSHAA
jgi:hypothetical protein